MASTAKDPQENQPEGQKTRRSATASDPAAGRVQEQVDRETDQGFRGVEVDPTPNEAYTVAGVTSGQPTPETDDEAAEQARKAQADAARRAAGPNGK